MEPMTRALGIIVSALTMAVAATPASAQLVAPVNTAPPTVSGSAVDMQTLTSSLGTWTGSATITYARRWLRCSDTTFDSCAEIPEATGSTYEVTSDDIGSRLRVEVTAANDAGSAWVASATTDVVAAVPPSNLERPRVSGIAADGELLVSGLGLWMGSPEITFTRQWERCDAGGGNCAAIDGATASSLRLSDADAGSTLRVRVTATNRGGSVSAASNVSAVVAGYPPTNLVPPTVTGTPQAGSVLVGGAGEWTGGPSFSFQWLRCSDLDFITCSPIPAATSKDYAATSDDVGSLLRFQVTATNSSGSAGMASAVTDPVVAAPVEPTPVPEPEDSGRATGLANAAEHAHGAPRLINVFECDQRCLVGLLVGFVTGSPRGKR